MDGAISERSRLSRLSHKGELLDSGRRGDAMALFMRSIGLPETMITGMRNAPIWPDMEAVAPTLAYDAAVMGDGLVPTGVVASITAPTQVLDGGDTGAWAASAAQALSAALPNPARRTLHGQNQNVAWDVLAPQLKDLFTPPSSHQSERSARRAAPAQFVRALTG